MRYDFDAEDIRRQLLDYLTSLDIQPYDESEIILDGELHRYRVHDEARGHTSGAVCIHADNWPAGFVQDWRKGIKENWKYDVSSLNDEQRTYFNSEEFRKKCEEGQRMAEEIRKAKKRERSEFARRLWEKLLPAPENHPYLQRKKVKSYGLRFSPEWPDGPIDSLKNCLAVPLKDISGQIISIQWIPADSEQHKLFYQGASLDGAFYSVGFEKLKDNPQQIILVGEGYATMAKVYELTGYPSVAAMSCHRLKEVAEILSKTYSENKIIMVADNDQETERKRGINPGEYYAELVVKAQISLGILVPEFGYGESGTDWDDYALLHGDTSASLLLKEKISAILGAERHSYYQAMAQELGELKSETFKEFIIPPQDTNWLIDSWIPSKGMTMLFAPSGSGKGFVALDMAFAIACEDITEWKGYKVLKHGHVIYFAGEGQRGMKKRCAGLCHALGVDPSQVKMDIISDTLPIDDPNPRAGIKRAIANIGSICIEPVISIFDTTNRYMCGDENKTVEAGAYIRSCQMIQEEFGCSVITIHHTGQSQDTQNRARGSSVFKASVDIELRLSKELNILTLEMTKSKDSEPPSPMKLLMKKVEVPGYLKSNGEPDETCILIRPEEAVASSELPSAGQSESEKLSASEEFAKRSYSEAACKYGRIFHDVERDKDIVSLRLEDWRSVFYGMSSADKGDTQRRQFNRAKRLLLETRQMLYKQEIGGEEYYCLTPTGNAYELGILLHLRRES